MADVEILRKLRETCIRDGYIVAIWEVPDDDKFKNQPASDVADAYAIVSVPEAICGLIVYGYSARDKKWMANWSARWVVAKLLKLSSLEAFTMTVREERG